MSVSSFSTSLLSTIAPVCSMVGREGNTRPQVKSDERRKRNKLNGMLCVDAVNGKEFFRLSPGSKTEDVSEYLAQLCLEYVELGYDQLCIILDNNPTHKHKMQSQLTLHLEQMGLAKSITVECLYLPPSAS